MNSHISQPILRNLAQELKMNHKIVITQIWYFRANDLVQLMKS